MLFKNGGFDPPFPFRLPLFNNCHRITSLSRVGRGLILVLHFVDTFVTLKSCDLCVGTLIHSVIRPLRLAHRSSLSEANFHWGFVEGGVADSLFASDNK